MDVPERHWQPLNVNPGYFSTLLEPVFSLGVDGGQERH